jgi:hypothetical protein
MTRSIRVRLNAAALLLAITGMIIQIASGVKYPTVPPGIVILAATALLIMLVRWPAIRVLGVLAPLFILIGGIASSTGRTNITQLDHLGKFLGTLIQFGGLALGVAAGIAAVIQWRVSRTAGDTGETTRSTRAATGSAAGAGRGRQA